MFRVAWVVDGNSQYGKRLRTQFLKWTARTVSSGRAALPVAAGAMSRARAFVAIYRTLR